MKKYNLHLIFGASLVALLAAVILISKLHFSKDYKIMDEVKDTKNNTTNVLLFVKVDGYDVEKLRDISKEITTKYINSESNPQNIGAIVLQIYKDGAQKDLDASDIQYLNSNYPKLAGRANDVQIVKNGYVYRAFYNQGKEPSVSLTATDLYLPKNGIKASDLLKD